MSRRKSTEEFIKECKLIHGDNYIYNKTIYTTAKTKVIITCKKHGDWTMISSNILMGQKCPKCSSLGAIQKLKENASNRRNWNLQQPDEYKLIPLTQGKFTMVDNEDFESLKDINWCCVNGYVYNNEIGFIHRLIMNCPSDMVIDHINHDKLDNRKENLRFATIAENNRNQRPVRNSYSKYKGVFFIKSQGKWEADICKNYTRYKLGRFTTEEEAGMAYDKKAIELYGEFAYLNFPELKEQYLK